MSDAVAVESVLDAVAGRGVTELDVITTLTGHSLHEPRPVLQLRQVPMSIAPPLSRANDGSRLLILPPAFARALVSALVCLLGPAVWPRDATPSRKQQLIQ